MAADRGIPTPDGAGRDQAGKAAAARVIEPRVLIENRTFDELEVGETAKLERTLSRRDIELFAVMSGDVNPAHVDEEYAHGDMFHKVIAHGMWGASLISTLLGTRLPGPGTIYLQQTLRFRRPVTIGDTVTVSVTVASKESEHHRVTIECTCVNQRDETVIDGLATVIAPTEKVSRPRVVLPEVRMHERDVVARDLVAKAKSLAPIRMAVVHPVDRDSLLGALQAAQEGLIVPVLVGPEERIRAVAEAHDLDIDELSVMSTEHSHQAAETAVALARDGQVGALMKGRLPNDELMSAVTAAASGLATDRRMSHVFVMDVPTYPRPLLITDAALNVQPDLQAKRDIVQNAIDLALAIGISAPKVAILSSVETVNPKLRSSLDAAALAKMAERGQIRGGVVDGPLGFDNAVSQAAARVEGIASPVAGQADIVVVPELETGNMLVKQLHYLGDSQAAGIVLAARVPIALSSRSDAAFDRVACAALAVLVAHAASASPARSESRVEVAI